MLKTLLWIPLFLFASLLQAKEALPFYQIDLIVFTHQQASTVPTELSLSSTITTPAKATRLDTEINKQLTPYHLLPFSFSQLKEEYWALHRKPQYRVLLHYTWLQPLSNQQSIALPAIKRDGWQLEGTVRVLRSNYYLLDTELLFSSVDDSKTPFVFAQKQRLKGGDIYYFDHPQAGMLIKVHQLS